MAHYDLLIRGARVIDAALGINKIADIGVTGEKIAALGELAGDTATRTLNASGLVASAGWIDLHVHCFFGHHHISIHPDRDCGVETGVTTVVDTGSFLASNFAQFREIAQSSVTRVLGYLNVSANEMDGPIHGDWQRFDQLRTIETAEQNRDLILGIKVLASQRHCGNLGIVPLELGVQAAREAKTGLMVHLGVAPPTIQQVLNLLDRGDVVTHCFKAFPGGIMNRAGRPVPEAWAALERGVYFDLGHGSGSFCFHAARQAIAAGFPLHAISTDLHQKNVKGPVYTQARTMAKYLHLGYSLPEVVRLSTWGPAQIIGRSHEFGSLTPGLCADITIFRVNEGPVVYTDSQGYQENGNIDLEAAFTVRAGRVVQGI